MGRREVRPLLLEDSLGPIRCLTLFPYAPMRIPGDFPEVTVRVLKVTRIATPKAIPRRVHDLAPAASACFMTVSTSALELTGWPIANAPDPG
jgi:hypothetical protein